MQFKRIYVASSWRNQQQPSVVAALRSVGHEVYDFKNPGPGGGFGWNQIDPDWQAWTPEQYLMALEHPIAKAGFRRDMDALMACDACVLVMPCGRSAHLELGWATGAGKQTVVLLDGPSEPELMYLMNTEIVQSMGDLLRALERPMSLTTATATLERLLGAAAATEGEDIDGFLMKRGYRAFTNKPNPTLADMTVLVDDFAERTAQYARLNGGDDHSISGTATTEAAREAADARVALLAAIGMLTERES